MEVNRKERYIRWQSYRIAQLSFSINLFLGFSVASLAYIINLKLGDKLIESNTIIIIWSVSALLGCLATISRLLDYRYTTLKIAKKTCFNQFMAKYCGPVTWGLFWSQILSYGIGALFFIFVVINA